MRIVTWNVNSLRARLGQVTAWLGAERPDVVCLQELKCEDGQVPRAALEDLGYEVATHGQKTYNGVAILSRHGLEDVRRGLPGAEDDPEARFIEAVIPAGAGAVRVASIYAPNGNPIDSPKFEKKLIFLERLRAHAQSLRLLEEPVVLAGDYNVIPRENDVHDPAAWASDALMQPQSRAGLRAILWTGYTDAFEAVDGRGGQYSFWDYQGGAWPKDHGVRIDHLLLSPQAADRLVGVEIARSARGMDTPSDHVPVVGTFRF